MRLLNKTLTSTLPSPQCQHIPLRPEPGPAALPVPQDKELPRGTLARWAELACNDHRPTARPPTHGTGTDPQGKNLPVPMILSILTLALSSSLAKRCTACTGSSQVSGSMYVLLVGILTARKEETPKGCGKGWAESCPLVLGSALELHPSPAWLAGLTCHLFISKAKASALRLLGNILWD